MFRRSEYKERFEEVPSFQVKVRCTVPQMGSKWDQIKANGSNSKQRFPCTEKLGVLSMRLRVGLGQEPEQSNQVPQGST